MPPAPLSPTNSRTSSHNASPQHEESLSQSIELFSPTPSIIQNKWPSPPPLPQRSPCIRRRHNLRNYVSLASTNESYDVCSSVGAPPPEPQLLIIQVQCKSLSTWQMGNPQHPPMDPPTHTLVPTRKTQ